MQEASSPVGRAVVGRLSASLSATLADARIQEANVPTPQTPHRWADGKIVWGKPPISQNKTLHRNFDLFLAAIMSGDRVKWIRGGTYRVKGFERLDVRVDGELSAINHSTKSNN